MITVKIGNANWVRRQDEMILWNLSSQGRDMHNMPTIPAGISNNLYPVMPENTPIHVTGHLGWGASKGSSLVKAQAMAHYIASRFIILPNPYYQGG